MSTVKKWRVRHENGEIIVAPNWESGYALMRWWSSNITRHYVVLEPFEDGESSEVQQNCDLFFQAMTWLVRRVTDERDLPLDDASPVSVAHRVDEFEREIARWQGLHADVIRHNNELLEENRRLKGQTTEVNHAVG